MNDERKVISPLRQMLMTVDTDRLLGFLHQMSIQYVLNRDSGGTYHANIYRDGMLRYKSSSGKSAKSALVDSISLFLVGEQKDFHGYLKDADNGSLTLN